MFVVDGLLIALLTTSAVIGIIIVLVKIDIVALKNAAQVKTLYSSLIVILLIFFIALTAKILMSDKGQMWLDSFSENGDCDKIDRPYWCDL